ncbi:MAG: hypothetical protein HWE26_14125 [Alteromonadaceae bacterium]|nr:hypothetical protein [Alteromonadaceae bacterium]
MEKLETVKKLVRANNYKNNDVTFKQCQKLGVTVNRVGLEMFARKLRSIDKADGTYQHDDYSKTSDTDISGKALHFDKSSIQLAERHDSDPLTSPSTTVSNVTHLKTVEPLHGPVAVDPIERKREITFELGTIKVREYELLQELNSLAHNDKSAEAF